MAQFREAATGRFASTFGGTFVLSRGGQWEECGVMMNNLVRAPQLLKDKIRDIAQTTIVQAVNEARISGNFAPNAESTIRIKGNAIPWIDTLGENSGIGVFAEAQEKGDGFVVKLDPAEEPQHQYVNLGTSRQPERNVYELAWENCASQVEAEVQDALADIMGGM